MSNATNYLTPYRWYNQFYKQSRFEKDCDVVCGFELLTDKNHLLPFQFKRHASPNPIADWILRPACNDPFGRVWSDADAAFVTLKNWSVSNNTCGAQDAYTVFRISSFTGTGNFAIVSAGGVAVVGFTVWDTDFDTTMTKLANSVNTNVSNGVKNPIVWPQPFDNHYGYRASWDIINQAFTFYAPAGTGASYNGDGASYQKDNGSLIMAPGCSQNQSLSNGTNGARCLTWVKSCDSIKNTDAGSGQFAYNPAPLTVGKEYKIFIKISEWANPGGAFTVLLKNGVNTIHTFSGSANIAGYYEYNFTAAYTDFHVEYSGQVPGDFIMIDEIDMLAPFVADAQDYVLDKSLLNLANAGGTSGSDYITYCASDLGQAIPPGTYYCIMRFLDTGPGAEATAGTYVSEGYAYYFSDLITIRDFMPEASPYIRLEWYNSCDIDDVKYSMVGACNYFNRLYIDGVLTKPEYPITEKGQTDGNEEFNPTFQKWNKKREIQFTKVPEFLIDALTSIRLHDFINVWEQIRDNQFRIVNARDAISIKSVEHDIQWILNDCRATFTLKCLLADKVVDETCCNDVVLSTCQTCSITVDYYNDDSDNTDGKSAIFFGSYNSHADGYYIYGSGAWNLQTIVNPTLICVPAECFIFYLTASSITSNPNITSETYSGAGSYSHVKLRGTILPNTYVRAQYSIDSGSTWTTIPGLPVDQATFLGGSGIQFTRPADSPNCGQTWYRVEMFDLNCVYCQSEYVVNNDSSGC